MALGEVRLQPFLKPVDIIITGLHSLFRQKRMEKGEGRVDPVDLFGERFEGAGVAVQRCGFGWIHVLNRRRGPRAGRRGT